MTEGIGHNSGRHISDDDVPGTLAKDQLRSIMERIERLEEEKKALSEDIREIYTEAKANGFDVKTLRAIVRLRKQDANERQEQEVLLELYMQALGMLADTELGQAALARVSA